MSFWDDRYRSETYAYGIEPNDFVRSEAGRIPPGRVLCLAEGEGRNAVFLASLGYAVTAVDLSTEGLRKAGLLAGQRGVTLDLVQADLSAYELEASAFSGIISIFAHLPVPVRRRLHAQISGALVPGGVFLLECYRPEQVALGTGGPRDAALLPALTDLTAELSDLDLAIARDAEREIHEGTFHEGKSATVQIVGVKRP